MSTFQEKDPECLWLEAHSPVETTIIPSAKDIGGFEVRRALPYKDKQMIGPFIFWDQMGPGEFLTNQGIDVRPHPHIGLSTLTYLFKGQIMHRDSLGTAQKIAPGAVNLMTAGKGIVHSERTDEEDRKAPGSLFGIQSWLALPKDREEQQPAFHHIQEQDIPYMEDEGKKVRIVMGNLFGSKSPVPTEMETTYADIALEAGAAIPIDSGIEERALYTLDGKIDIGGITYQPGQLLVLRPGDEITVRSQNGARFILLGGDAMSEKRYIYWNFVSSSKERIEQAKEDWIARKFPDVPGDPDEFIPLPGQKH